MKNERSTLTTVSSTNQLPEYFYDTNGIRHDVGSTVIDLNCHMHRLDWQWRHDAWRLLLNMVAVSMVTAVFDPQLVHRHHIGFAVDREIRSHSVPDEYWWMVYLHLFHWLMVHVAKHCWAVSLHYDSPCWLDSHRMWIRDW